MRLAALAVQKSSSSGGRAFILEVGARGSVTQRPLEVPLSLLGASGLSAEFLRASLFPGEDELVIAAGHADSLSSTIINLGRNQDRQMGLDLINKWVPLD